MELNRTSEPEFHESGIPDWFLTYGDLMTLLLCFFVMLYAMSTLQVPKMQAAVESFRGGFTKQGPLEHLKQSGQQTIVSPTITVSQGNKARLQTTFSDEKSVKGGVIHFEINSDELSDEAKRQLNKLIEELADSPFKIQITGHAEHKEQGTFRDAIDLSYSRAVNVCRYFASQGMNQNDFRIHAAGSSEPVEMDETNSQQVNTCVDLKLIINSPRNKEKNKTNNELKKLKLL
ncbi:MAG: OmpA family protein [Planctomycetaceae bacterium]|jgi:chemotaxis protein MotB|nr:OmpA family protein [Planctomycetaceae bacterium]